MRFVVEIPVNDANRLPLHVDDLLLNKKVFIQKEEEEAIACPSSRAYLNTAEGKETLVIEAPVLKCGALTVTRANKGIQDYVNYPCKPYTLFFL